MIHFHANPAVAYLFLVRPMNRLVLIIYVRNRS
jgi:hypothetical protein